MKRLLAALLLCSCSVLPPDEPSAPIPGRVEDIFLAVAEGLHQRLPVTSTVRIGITEELPAQYRGLTWVDPLGVIQIRVRPSDSLDGMLETLVHEWAHAAVIRASQEDPHDALWGVAYSRAYRIELAMLEELRKGEGPPAEASGGPSGDSPGGGSSP